MFSRTILYKKLAGGCHAAYPGSRIRGRTPGCSVVVHFGIVPGKRGFDQQLAQLESLRNATESERQQGLRKALGNRNNFLVAKAADLARELNLTQLTDALLEAFDRFFENPEKTDPQCWAKNALSRALAAFEYQGAETFLRGIEHIQLEPVWGGRSDTAGTLRSTCALALVQCTSLAEAELLAHLVDLFADKDKAVRREVARALEQVGSPTAGLVLRLRAKLGADEPEVLGACYSGVLGIEGVSAIPWIGRFLASADDAAAEAALAISSTHSPEAVEALRQAISKADDGWFRAVLLSTIALTRQDSAVEFLLDLVKSESPDAERAIEAIVRSMPAAETMKRLKTITGLNPRLARALAALKTSC